ncbi:hypothetical protein DRN85_10025, partial [Methanosarcinales archaeon]
MTRKVLVNLVVLFGLASLAAAGTIYVPEDYTTIQWAIDAAADGDTVLVADNTWTGAGNRGIDFGGKSITVQSENGPANCIIDCEWADHAFTFHSGETNSSVLRGFTIKNGYSYFGGAIECTYSSPTIRDCIISGNYANYYGGGIECFNASPFIFNCLFYNNRAFGYGGAIDCEDASPKIYNCTFVKNRADLDGGGIFSSWGSNPEVISCIFNSCGNHAIYEYPQTLDSDVRVLTSLFYENHIDPDDPYSPLADYYDADTDETYAGKNQLNNIPDGYVTAAFDNNPRFVPGPASAFVQEPLGNFYLSQTAAGQLYTSKCVDEGYSPVYPNPFVSDPDYTYTTRTDNVAEDNNLDIGYHYRDTGPPNEYYLVTEVQKVGDANGTVEPYHEWPGVAYKEFSEVRLTPVPADNSKVTWWEGTEDDGEPWLSGQYPQGERSNLVKITADNVDVEDKIIVAVEFSERDDYRLTATAGAGGQTQTITPPDVEPDRYYEFEYVELQAIPDAGYVVRGWTGLWEGVDIVSQNMEQVWVLMYGDRTVQVEFVTDFVELTVLFDPSLGWVHPRGGRYPYPAPGQPPVVETLEVSPEPGYRVGGYWENGQWHSTHDNTIFVTMDDNKTVEVLLEPVPSYLLTIEYLPSADGLIHGWAEPSGYLWPEGSQVELTAHPDPCYVASEWIGIDTESPPDHPVVTIMGPTTVQVRFRHTRLPGGASICVYAGTATGEPDWAGGLKPSDPNSPCYPGYCTIQDAIDAAQSGVAGPYIVEGDDAADPPLPAIEERPGDIVVAANGVYTGQGNRDLDFHGKLITVRSEFGPANCTIDCGGSANNPHRAFVFSGMAPALGDVVYDEALGSVVVPGAENNSSIVDGFTIING